MNAKKFYVNGRVQGVFFRKYTAVKAKELQLQGWVRNRSDGSVEIVAQGSLEKLEQFQQWLWQGSPASEVGSVRQEEHELLDKQDFSVEKTL